MILVTLTTIVSHLPVKQIENYIVPYKLGNARLVQGHHDFVYKIQGQNLFEHVHTLLEQVNLVNATFIRKTKPNVKVGYDHINNIRVHVNFTRSLDESQSRSMYSLITLAARSVKQTELKLKSIFPEFIRNKRSPFNAVGSAANWLFGIMDNQEKERIDNAINILQKNQEKLHIQQKWSISILKSISTRLTETFNELRENQERIGVKIKEIAYAFEQLTFYQMLQNANELIMQNNNIMYNVLSEIQDTIVFSSLGKLHPSIISTKEIREIIYQLKSLYNPQQLLSFQHTYNYYLYFNIRNYMEKNEIIFKISVPILYQSIYNLFYIYSVPYNNYIIPISKPYLLIEDSTYSSRIASCPKLEDIHICDDVPLPLEDNCVLNLLKNEDKCAKIKVHLKETLVQQIGRGDLLVYTPDSVNIYYNCNEVGIVTVTNNVLINLDYNCSVRINNDKFIFQEDLLRGEIFNLPKLDLNTYNVTNEESIQLNKVNIKDFEKLQKMVQNQKIPELEKVTKHSSYINYTITSIVILIIIIVFCYTRIKLICKTKQTTAIPGNQSQDLSGGQDPF